jgi:transmembrane 9 superfamily member 2/4
MFLSYKRSSLAVPLTTLLTLFMLWFGVSVPITFFGSYLGFRRDEVRCSTVL